MAPTPQLSPENKRASLGPSSGHPLFLDPEYENTGPGNWTLREIEPPKVKTNHDEKDIVREFVGLMLQASRVLHTGPEPEPLDNGVTSSGIGSLAVLRPTHTAN